MVDWDTCGEPVKGWTQQHGDWACCMQVPSMVITYVKPGTEVKPGENVPVGLQHYPGPLKYPFMHSFLSTFAGMMG